MNKTENAMELLKNKMCDISLDYADCVKKRMEHYLKEDEFESTALEEINQGIRMLNHVTAAVERIVRLQGENVSGR